MGQATRRSRQVVRSRWLDCCCAVSCLLVVKVGQRLTSRQFWSARAGLPVSPPIPEIFAQDSPVFWRQYQGQIGYPGAAVGGDLSGTPAAAFQVGGARAVHSSGCPRSPGPSGACGTVIRRWIAVANNNVM
jgi:hypothetical protein